VTLHFTLRGLDGRVGSAPHTLQAVEHEVETERELDVAIARAEDTLVAGRSGEPGSSETTIVVFEPR
jgi:hypothetical protein